MLPPQKTQYVKDLKDKENVSSPFLIKFSAVVMGKNGKPYMNIILADKSGELEARLWEDVNLYMGQAVRDNFMQVEGRCQTYQGRKQVVISKMQLLREDEVQAREYIPEGTLDADILYKKLMDYVGTVQDPFYRGLADSILRDDAELLDLLMRAPAAKTLHHAYRAGWLEHVVSIAGILDQLATHYGKVVDRDLLLVGGFLHDIGKLHEMRFERVTDYTTEGRLVGHLVMGVELVDRKIRELEAQEGRLPGSFPEDKKLLIKHLILSHHGLLEYGSPKRPKCLEALILSMVDDLDSKVNGLRVFMEQDQTPGRWTTLNRQHDRFFYKPDPSLERALEQA